MTVSQFAAMSPIWISRTVGLELVATTLETFRGPRFAELVRNGDHLRWSTKPWWFPKPMCLYHVRWVDLKTGDEFHRTRIDPLITGTEGDKVELSGTLKINVGIGTIDNIL